MSAYSVVKYSDDALLELLAQHSKETSQPSDGEAHRELVKQKLHNTYFKEYFLELQAATIVVEHEYIDRDYLEDYVSYYAKCFTPPKRHCIRLHFFQSSFCHEELDEFLTGKTDRPEFIDSHLTSDSYIGYIVVRPLTDTFVGRTCLKTYETKDTDRYFPALRTYEVHLFGLLLTVRSLAFQEQDTEVARCATAALWSTFQATARMYGHTVPTPVEITKSALSIHSYQSRTLPAKDGLTLEQMGDAIRSLHLEPHFSDLTERTYFQAEAYAYLRAGIPALLVVALIDTTDQWDKPRPEGEFTGLHAVALTGYRLDEPNPVPIHGTTAYVRAGRISRFYAHDDQIGPFSRMTFCPNGQSCSWKYDDSDPQTNHSYFLSTSWSGESGRLGSVVAVPQTLIVPLYPKMRVTFREAMEGMQKVDAILKRLVALGHLAMPNPLEWDMFLTTNFDAKEEWLNSTLLPGESAKELLTESMPKYLWRAIAYSEGQPVFELLFDATAIIQSNFFFRGVEYDPTLLTLFRQPGLLAFANNDPLMRSIMEWFRDH